MQTSFAQSVSVVTGAARGIGFEIARQLLLSGDHVVLLDMDGVQLDAALQTLKAEFANNVSAHQADVSDEVQIERIMQAISRQRGAISSLVNNAGIAIFKPIGQTSVQEWSRVLEVNLLQS
jgi:meso-butanediol dehydrogenase / (S,S)-butanediol dehydrogenase / diacetyl reductase